MMNRIWRGQSRRRISYIFVIIAGRGSDPSWRVQWRVYCTVCGRCNLIHTCRIVRRHKSTTVFDIRSCYVLVRALSLYLRGTILLLMSTIHVFISATADGKVYGGMIWDEPTVRVGLWVRSSRSVWPLRDQRSDLRKKSYMKISKFGYFIFKFCARQVHPKFILSYEVKISFSKLIYESNLDFPSSS